MGNARLPGSIISISTKPASSISPPSERASYIQWWPRPPNNSLSAWRAGRSAEESRTAFDSGCCRHCRAADADAPAHASRGRRDTASARPQNAATLEQKGPSVIAHQMLDHVGRIDGIDRAGALGNGPSGIGIMDLIGPIEGREFKIANIDQAGTAQQPRQQRQSRQPTGRRIVVVQPSLRLSPDRNQR